MHQERDIISIEVYFLLHQVIKLYDVILKTRSISVPCDFQYSCHLPTDNNFPFHYGHVRIYTGVVALPILLRATSWRRFRQAEFPFDYSLSGVAFVTDYGPHFSAPVHRQRESTRKPLYIYGKKLSLVFLDAPRDFLHARTARPIIVSSSFRSVLIYSTPTPRSSRVFNRFARQLCSLFFSSQRPSSFAPSSFWQHDRLEFAERADLL